MAIFTHVTVGTNDLKRARAFYDDMHTRRTTRHFSTDPVPREAIEWAIRDGVPYAIDFMNPAPDMDINSTGLEYHRWCVEKMADMCIRLAKTPKPQVAEVKWSTMFNG